MEQYLKECIDSIITQQTSYTYCVYIVDDGSTDDSTRIVDEYSSVPGIKVIHKINGGLSSARNTALEEKCSDYIMFVDSDDRLCQGAVQKLMDVAKEKDADIVQGGFVKLMTNNQYGATMTCREKQKIGFYQLSGYSCGKVYSSSLYDEIIFPVSYWFEDTVNSMIIHPSSSGRIYEIPDIVYEYRENPAVITKIAHKHAKVLDTFYIFARLLADRTRIGLPEDIQFVSNCRRQICLNARRIINLPESIRFTVFVLSSKLYIMVFDRNKGKSPNKSDALLYKICTEGDFTNFELAVKWLIR